MKRWGVLSFLGSNCDRDVVLAGESLGFEVELLDHRSPLESRYDLIVLPGGFSYGDYLRPGALAAKTRAAQSLKRIRDLNIPILGICNGFQILCELGLLPGILIGNLKARFINQWVQLSAPKLGDLMMPIAHGCGRYTVPVDMDLNAVADLSWIQYQSNPNASIQNVAGIKQGRVFGLMPHPERACLDHHDTKDGIKIFEEVLGS